MLEETAVCKMRKCLKSQNHKGLKNMAFAVICSPFGRLKPI